MITVSINGSFATLAPIASGYAISTPLFGLGKITINVTAVADNVVDIVEKNANALILGPFILSRQVV